MTSPSQNGPTCALAHLFLHNLGMQIGLQVSGLGFRAQGFGLRAADVKGRKALSLDVTSVALSRTTVDTKNPARP